MLQSLGKHQTPPCQLFKFNRQEKVWTSEKRTGHVAQLLGPWAAFCISITTPYCIWHSRLLLYGVFSISGYRFLLYLDIFSTLFGTPGYYSVMFVIALCCIYVFIFLVRQITAFAPTVVPSEFTLARWALRREKKIWAGGRGQTRKFSGNWQTNYVLYVCRVGTVQKERVKVKGFGGQTVRIRQTNWLTSWSWLTKKHAGRVRHQ